MFTEYDAADIRQIHYRIDNGKGTSGFSGATFFSASSIWKVDVIIKSYFSATAVRRFCSIEAGSVDSIVFTSTLKSA